MMLIGGQLPAVYICRVVMDPVDPNTVYIAFNGYGLTNPGQQIWVTQTPRIFMPVPITEFTLL